MPEPRRKENGNKSTKSKAPVGQESWRSEIERMILNDDGWRCVVAMLVETEPEESRYIEFFNKAAEEGKREAIFALSYDKLIRMVKSMAISGLDQGICQFASRELGEAGATAMSPWLLSRLIKFFIHRAKTRNLEILDARVGARSENPGKVGETALKKSGTAAPGSKGGSGDAKKSFKVDGRKVKKRGEEWKDKVRIEDAPIDGPDLYVVLSGFRDPGLPLELLNVGVPLTAIFRVVEGAVRNSENEGPIGEFWSSVETALKKPATAESYCKIIFQNFCPPELPEELEEPEIELWQADAYKRISSLTYDLDDITRQHANYIRNMSLQPGLEEARPEVQKRGMYDAIMRLIPEECASVPLVLDALLEQVVDGAEGGDGSEVKGEAAADEESGRVKWKSKIDCLNREFDVLEFGRAKTSPCNSDPRLIIHGDTLSANTHHCSMGLIAALSRDSRDSGLDFGIRVLRESRISALWRGAPGPTPDRDTMYAFHLEQVSKCLEPSEGRAKTSHCLHLLLFDEMVNGRKQRSNIQEREDLERKVPFPGPEGFEGVRRASETLASLRSSSCKEKAQPTMFHSDSNIDYKKSIEETFECPELFRLVDAREVIGSGFISDSVTSPNPGKSFGQNFDVDEFDIVQILSADIFAQIFNQCSEEYNTLETRYFAPTDSLLVLFCNRLTSDGIFETRYNTSIRTPVCLGDFARFVAEEEREWIEKEEAAHTERIAELSALPTNPEDPVVMTCGYTDADFILRNSIKGKQKSREVRNEEKRRESRSKEAGKIIRGTADTKIKDEGTKVDSRRKRNSSSQTNPSSRTAEGEAPLNFLGYNLGNHRVQVSGSRSEFFSEDGTRVRVELEEWTYAEPELRVAISLFGNDLVAHSVASNRQIPPKLHFRTRNGIVMDFGTPRAGDTMDAIFRASWPSGLLVETRSDVGTTVPFYVRQYYLSKGPECREILNESFRLFLSNGTIVVFLDDESARLLCPNGTIVTYCSGSRSPNMRKEDPPTSFSSASRTRNAESSGTTLESVRMKQKSFERISKTTTEGVPGFQSPVSIHSVILDPEGKRYEVFDGRIIRELEEELLRTWTDYEVGEKLIRRNDGTDILMNSEGVLTVCFPDGSRITTGYVVEKELVHCDWTEDEFEISSESSAERESFSKESLSESDGFVSILITHSMEHKNYSTVTFDRSKNDCTLSMPGKVSVRIPIYDRTIGVTIDASLSLEVGSQEIVLRGQTLPGAGGSSTSVYNLEHFSKTSPPIGPLVHTTDPFGNFFKVDFAGNTSYEKIVQGVSDGQQGDSSSSQIKSRGCRLFAVRRDLAAFEYLRSSENDEACRDETTSVFRLRIPDHPEQELRTTLTALNPITISRGWLQPYKVPKIRIKNSDRQDLLRSTYSIPWDYLIPYGKKLGMGTHDQSWNEPLKNQLTESSVPEVLLGRTTYRIKKRDEKMVSQKLRTALGCYWKKTINRFNEYRGLVAGKSATPWEREIEEWLNDYALGRKKTFNEALYSLGLVKNQPARNTSKQPTSIPLAQRISKKISEEEIEWYKNCLRDRIVPPYFADVPGACFTWILKCVNEIEGQESRKENEEEEK